MADNLGYVPSKEDRVFLRRTQAAFGATPAHVAEAPKVIDHRGWLRVENQGNMSSCVGHGDSSALEVCNYYDTGGEIIQLSRMYAYLTAQQESGLFGRDQGATISGAVKANLKYGICRDETYPYPGRYSTSIPSEANAEAQKHKLLRHTVVDNYGESFNWLATGQGAVIIGVRWVQSLAETTGVVEQLRGGGNEFHCMAILGYSDRRDSLGRQYPWLVNSHGRGWGNQGWAEIAPSVVDQWCRRNDYEEVVGVSDLEEYSFRKLDYVLG